MAAEQSSVSPIVSSGLACLIIGGAVGACGMMLFGQQDKKQAYVAPPATKQLGLTKRELEDLVTKLDALTHQPLKVNLTPEQAKKVAEEARTLSEAKTLDEESARKHLRRLLSVLKDQKETLVAAGFTWPGQGGGERFPTTVAAVRVHLASLESLDPDAEQRKTESTNVKSEPTKGK